MMSLAAVLSGITLIIAGIIHLPPFPASPETLSESKVMAAFFFGGSYLICAAFAHKYPKQGKVGLFIIAAIGAFGSIRDYVKPQEGSLFIPLLITAISLLIYILIIVQWRRSRYVIPEEELRE